MFFAHRYGLFGRLLRQCVAALDEGATQRCLDAQLRHCTKLLLEVVETNVVVRAELPLAMLQAVFEVQEAHVGKHAELLFGKDGLEERCLELDELVLSVARKSLTLEGDPEPEQLAEMVRMMFRPSARGAERVVDSPNYGLLRKKQKQNPAEAAAEQN